jgi:UDP-N-acetylglucosamine 4,6-dehydratase
LLTHVKGALLDNQTILLTGGTGSFGHVFVKETLERYNPKKLIIFSRDEMKQWEMAKKYSEDPRVRFFIGDVRDKDRLLRATTGVDIVIHAAATKIVPTAEYNPFEAIKTNIHGAMNLVDACIDNGVKKVVALSTDKASSPINLYGATKLVSDKLFVAGNNYAGAGPTRFSVVRYGNVMGSRGSVIPFFLSKKGEGSLPITDPEMTRFMITLEEGVQLVWTALEEMQGGEIYVKKIPSMKVVDIARAIDPSAKLEVVGIRPGEKIHEQMISSEDASSTYDCGSHYVILPQSDLASRVEISKLKGKKVDSGFLYSSESNNHWMTRDELILWIQENADESGNIPLK